MKFDPNLKVRKVAGENLIVGQGATHTDLTKIISLNHTALFLWEQLSGKDFSVADAADLLVKKYGIDAPTAEADASAWIEKMKSEGVILPTD